MRLARAANLSAREAIDRFTIRRGSILKFTDDGACAALEGSRCGVHRGRPLACRLYPLGLERIEESNSENFVMLEPAIGSLGDYGIDGDVNSFLDTQGVAPYLAANARYASLLAVFRERIVATVDFDRVEPREFWRRAVREALAESNYDANPLIDAMFDASAIAGIDDAEIVARHVERLAEMIRGGCDPRGEFGVFAARSGQLVAGAPGDAGAAGAALATPRSLRISIACVDGSTLG
jgi:Fe-S-cluster containining protein